MVDKLPTSTGSLDSFHQEYVMCEQYFGCDICTIRKSYPWYGFHWIPLTSCPRPHSLGMSINTWYVEWITKMSSHVAHLVFWTNLRDDQSLKNIAPTPKSQSILIFFLGDLFQTKPPSKKWVGLPFRHHPPTLVKLPRLKFQDFSKKPRSVLNLFEAIFFAGFVANGLDCLLFRAPREKCRSIEILG